MSKKPPVWADCGWDGPPTGSTIKSYDSYDTWHTWCQIITWQNAHRVRRLIAWLIRNHQNKWERCHLHHLSDSILSWCTGFFDRYSANSPPYELGQPIIQVQNQPTKVLLIARLLKSVTLGEKSKVTKRRSHAKSLVLESHHKSHACFFEWATWFREFSGIWNIISQRNGLFLKLE